MKKRDIFLIFALAAAILVVFTLTSLAFGGDGRAYAVVEVAGVETARLPLDTDTEYLIESENGKNLLVIKDGRAYVSEASCPDKICVKTGALDESDTLNSIVCLPNKVTVFIDYE
ncbi:MAG: NusG domain II-containing protein [Clostridiales bacterium]|nr:NusG domain II-containing protein [Clostridiales bacterium]